MDKYYFQETRFPGVWELGTLDPIPLNKISKYYTSSSLGQIKSDRRVRQLMQFLGFKFRPRHAKNPQNSSNEPGFHVDGEDYFLLGNPNPRYLRKVPWMIILIAADDPHAQGTKIKRFFGGGYLEAWRIYLMHRCVLHDSPEPQPGKYRLMNRYDIKQFPEPKCLHNYRRKLRNKHKAIAEALLK